MVNRCVVNGCTSGSVSDRNKHKKLDTKNPSLFTVPQHLDLLELWESELSQKLVPKKNYVCELHFNEEDIIKSDKIKTANGIIEELVRERYALKQGAIPTLNPKKLSESRNIKDVNSPNSPSTEAVASEPNNIVYINENYSHQDSELQIDEDCNSNYDRLENFNSRISSEEINHENEEPSTMPKTKRPLETTRISSRRQASKEALKQMQLLLDDEEDDAFVVPDDNDSDKDVRLELHKKKTVSPIIEPPPKKKYKLSHRKSSDGNDRDVIVLKSISSSNYVPKENTLELECFVEELTDCQIEMRKKIDREEKELQAKLDELMKGKHAEVVYKGEFSSAVEVNELISNSKKSFFKPNQLPQLGSHIDESAPAYQLVMDPRLGIIVGTVQKNPTPSPMPPPLTKSKLQISSAVKSVATIPQSQSSPTTRNMRSRRGTSTPSTPIQTRANNAMPTRQNNVTPTKTNTPAKGNNVTSARSNISTPSRGNNSVPNRGGTVFPTRGSSMLTRATLQVASPSSPTPPVVQTRGMKTVPASTVQTRNSKISPTGKRPVANVPLDKPKQVVDLTSDDSRNQVDNREISFNKLQGKTYPSLIVVARPHLRVTDLVADRSKLDSKVKSVLMHPPAKFTEWLIQQGLIRAEQKCPLHSNTQLKLGMYSDVSKFPFSGGYVWISECCPQRFISVFNGSIFEGSPNPPMVMLKLIYHWSCQTNVQNVTQWVKVDNLYVKGVYTWLRGVCTVAIQSRIRQLGGPGSKIEVGVISLGTTSHDGSQRQVKVEVLGILESSTKCLRLRAIEPMPDGDRNFRKKFSKILEPILQWVHPDSTIVTDLTVDKTTLHHMGFGNVVQTTSNDYNNSNRTIMEYLRRIVPRMFQNTLSLLSRQIIQQFLDELVWREWFGITAQQAFDNIISHLAEQTRTNNQASLVLRLNKVAANPFKCWNGTPGASQATTSTPALATTNQTPTATTSTPAKTTVSEVKRYGRGRKSNSPQVPVVQERPNKPVSPDVPEQMVPLEKYYYGIIDSFETSPKSVDLSMKCPFCKSTFDNNLQLQNHLFKHAHNVSDDAYLCRYCLTSVSTANELLYHVNKCHPGETKFANGFVCLICEAHYVNPFVLGKHMSKEHSPHELPYECGSCSFRCSNHKQIIDHFYVKHDGGTTIQCPFCLKSTRIWSGGRNITQNMHYFIEHLQKHQKKQLAKKCGKCNLWFVQKDILKEHQATMHVSLRGRLGLVPCSSPRNGVMVPKSKMDKNPCDAEIINFASLYYNIPSNSLCKECDQAITSPKHFPSFDSCQNPNCQYSTCCANAMMTHNAKCKGLNSIIPPELLPFEMFCVCGHKDADGNSMARHLATCEKKSAYSSQAEATSATVMHNMLDILGLVRKPEEAASSKLKEKEEVLSFSRKPEDKDEPCFENVENSNEISIAIDDNEDKIDSGKDNNMANEKPSTSSIKEFAPTDSLRKDVDDNLLQTEDKEVDETMEGMSEKENTPDSLKKNLEDNLLHTEDKEVDEPMDIEDINEKENTLENRILDTNMEEPEIINSEGNVDINRQDVNSKKIEIENLESQTENQEKTIESENEMEVVNIEHGKENLISNLDNEEEESCNTSKFVTATTTIGDNSETIEKENKNKNVVHNLVEDEQNLFQNDESLNCKNDKIVNITEENSKNQSCLEANESNVLQNNAELGIIVPNDFNYEKGERQTYENVEHKDEERRDEGNERKKDEIFQETTADAEILLDIPMTNEGEKIKETDNTGLADSNRLNVHSLNDQSENKIELPKETDEQISNTENSEKEITTMSCDSKNICFQEVESGNINENSSNHSNEMEFCEESLSDKLSETALNDILSSSNNVTPIDVDLDSELTEVGAPMEVE